MEVGTERAIEQPREQLCAYELALCAAAEEFVRPLELIEWNRYYLQEHLELHGREYSASAVEQSLQDIHMAIAGMNRLVDHFTQLCACMCGTVPVQQTCLDLASLLRSLCADHEAIYRAIGVRLTLEYDPGELYNIIADPVLTERVLLHLLGSGLRACSEGDTVAFRLDHRRGELLLSVQDNGRSMTAESSGALYRPRSVGDTGVGLILCDEYCRMLNWKLELAPQEKGRTVSIVIPERRDTLSQVVLHSSVAGRQVVSRIALLQELHTVPGLENLSPETD